MWQNLITVQSTVWILVTASFTASTTPFRPICCFKDHLLHIIQSLHRTISKIRDPSFLQYTTNWHGDPRRDSHQCVAIPSSPKDIHIVACLSPSLEAFCFFQPDKPRQPQPSSYFAYQLATSSFHTDKKLPHRHWFRLSIRPFCSDSCSGLFDFRLVR